MDRQRRHPALTYAALVSGFTLAPVREIATWNNDPNGPLRWKADGTAWLPTSLVRALPAGRWTTYGDLAEVIGTGAQALGQHIAACSSCQHPWRVLNAQGKVAEGFTWSDPDRTEAPRQLLENEGLTFTNGVADPSAHLGPSDLSKLLRDSM